MKNERDMVAHHWMKAPQLYNLSWYLTFWYLSNSSVHVPGHLVGWLNFITHILLCPITRKLDAPVQILIMSTNQVECAS
jgi:hypothetical protein